MDPAYGGKLLTMRISKLNRIFASLLKANKPRAMKHAAAAAALFTALLAATGASAAQKPTNDDCLTCHGDASLTKDVNGKTVSLHVDPEKFKNSMHGGMFSCVDCHTDVKTSPHENTPAKVSCATCHADQQAAGSEVFMQNPARVAALVPPVRIAMAVPHELLGSSDAKSRTNHANIPATCGSCHNQSSRHGKRGRRRPAIRGLPGERPWQSGRQRKRESRRVYGLPILCTKF